MSIHVTVLLHPQWFGLLPIYHTQLIRLFICTYPFNVSSCRPLFTVAFLFSRQAQVTTIIIPCFCYCYVGQSESTHCRSVTQLNMAIANVLTFSKWIVVDGGSDFDPFQCEIVAVLIWLFLPSDALQQPINPGINSEHQLGGYCS